MVVSEEYHLLLQFHLRSWYEDSLYLLEMIWFGIWQLVLVKCLIDLPCGHSLILVPGNLTGNLKFCSSASHCWIEACWLNYASRLALTLRILEMNGMQAMPLKALNSSDHPMIATATQAWTAINHLAKSRTRVFYLWPLPSLQQQLPLLSSVATARSLHHHHSHLS